MKTLVVDTCHKNLVIGCFEDENRLASFSEKAWKMQSEHFFGALNECMEKAGWKPDQIDQIILTDGPGSYTGERIAMTFAKVLCTQTKTVLYRISTYMIYAGLQKCEVILDARSNRVYCGSCEDGKLICECIKTLDEIKEDKEKGILIVGDIDLIGEEYKEIDFVANFMAVKDSWVKVDNVHTLTPHYLKSKEELVK